MPDSHHAPNNAAIERNGLYPYLADFLERTAVTGLSKDTLKRRRSALRRFIAWCDERELHNPADITRPILERYQRHLYYYRKRNGEPLSIGSQNVMMTPLKAFFRWLARDNHIAFNPASELELPRKPRRLPRDILSPGELDAIFAQPDIDTPEGLRDRAMMELLYATGIRRAELGALELYDIDARRRALMVREGKGRHDRVLPLSERALEWVQLYLFESRPRLLIDRHERALFLNAEGTRYRRSNLAQHIKRHIVAAGVKRDGACHLFRHAMATHMLDNGADIRFIQAMLGHTDLSTTTIYTQVSIEKLRRVHAATHPTGGAHATRPDEHTTGDEAALLRALDDERRSEHNEHGEQTDGNAPGTVD